MPDSHSDKPPRPPAAPNPRDATVRPIPSHWPPPREEPPSLDPQMGNLVPITAGGSWGGAGLSRSSGVCRWAPRPGTLLPKWRPEPQPACRLTEWARPPRPGGRRSGRGLGRGGAGSSQRTAPPIALSAPGHSSESRPAPPPTQDCRGSPGRRGGAGLCSFQALHRADCRVPPGSVGRRSDEGPDVGVTRAGGETRGHLSDGRRQVGEDRQTGRWEDGG